MNEQEFAELAAGHALHALSPADEASYLEALAQHPEWEAVAVADARAAASLGDSVAAVAPPLTMRSNLLVRIGSLPQEVGASAGASAGSAGVAGVSAGADAGAPLRRDRPAPADVDEAADAGADAGAGTDDVTAVLPPVDVADAAAPVADATVVLPAIDVAGAAPPVADATVVLPAIDVAGAAPPVADATVVLPAADVADAVAPDTDTSTIPEDTDTDTDTDASPEATDDDPLADLLREGTSGRPTDAAPLSAAALADVLEPGAARQPRDGDEPVPTTTAMQAVVRRSWVRGLLALAASFTLLVGIGFGAGALYNYINRPAAVVALQEIESAPDAQSATVAEEGLSATAHWSEEVGKAVLVSDGLPAIPADETFELWLIRDDEPIAAGTFAADGASATAVVEGEMQPGDVIAITVEPAGGAPGGIPTGDPIVAVPTA